MALWNEVDGQTKLITAANFCQNGKYAVIGTYDGRCIFYDTEVSPAATIDATWFIQGRQPVSRMVAVVQNIQKEAPFYRLILSQEPTANTNCFPLSCFRVPIQFWPLQDAEQSSVNLCVYSNEFLLVLFLFST